MDTAAVIAAFALFNQVLLTPPGQVLFTNANTTVVNLFNHLGAHLALALPPPPTPSARAPASPAAPPSQGSVADAFATLKSEAK